MVDIAPFKGLSYNLNKISDIAKTLAPPYDIISEIQREALEKQDQHNIVSLTLPRESGFNTRYENSRILLDKWIEDGVLTSEKNKCFYIFEEEFFENKEKKSFKGFIGLLKIEEYAAGKVLRHEKTLPKPKEDRLNLLKATRSNLEFIYTLYNDSDNKLSSVLNPFTIKKPFISTPVCYDPGLFFRLWKIDDREALNDIIGLMKNKSLLIADGHHRYETSRLYKDRTAETVDGDGPENYILALFASSTQKDILIHPTHRLVKFDFSFKPAEILKALEDHFIIEQLEDPSESKIENRMKEASLKTCKRLCMYFGKDACFIITLKDSLKNIYKKSGLDTGDFDEEFEYLDVNILHRLLFQSLLSRFKIGDIKFVHTIDEIINNIESIEKKDDGSCLDAGFILNPPSISTVESLSNAGKIMPQKSTYFYPKPCSGLVLYKFDI